MFARRAFRCISTAGAVMVALCGCGPPEFVNVEGTVTLDGQPLENAFVTFLPEGETTDRKSAGFGKTDSDGEYELAVSHNQEGIRPGLYRVEIRTSDAVLDERGREITLPELVPAKYNVKTELTNITVEPSGSQTFDFPLESEGTVYQERVGR